MLRRIILQSGTVNASSMASCSVPSVHRSPLEVIDECGQVEQRIDLDQTKLYGRSSEVEIIRNGFHRTVRGRSELIVLKGQAGAGKTRLVESALRQYVAEFDVHGGFFVSGKCEPSQNDPFAAIVSALTELVGLVLESEEREETRNEFNETFSDVEIRELVQLIPKLGEIARQVPEIRIRQCPAWDDDSSPSGYAPFIFLCRSLVKFLVTPTRPVVIFFDDIHSIDADSLSLLDALVTDETSTNLLLVCSTRDLGTPAICTSSDDACMPISEIVVGDLTLHQITELFSDFFQMENASPLMEVVLRKASSNILHIVQYLDFIQLQGFLQQGEEGWAYQLKEITENMCSYESLDGLLDFKIRSLGIKVNQVMKVASYLGSQFRFETLVYSWRALNFLSWEDSVQSVNAALKTATHQGYLTQTEDVHAFVHDSYRMCWYNMMPEERDPYLVHLQIGLAIRSQMLIDQDWSLLHTAADHVWRGRSHACKEATVRQAMSLLHEASRSALGRGMFERAKSFALATVQLLEGDAWHWKNQYRMSVDVFCNLVNVEMMLGDFEKAYHVANGFLAHSASFDDTVKAHLLVMKCLGRGGKYKEAKRQGILGLRFLGEPIPESNLLMHLVREAMHAAKALREKTDEDIVSLPLMRCTRKIAAMAIWSSLISISFLSMKGLSDRLRFCLIGLRMMSLSLAYGVCEDSCVGLACYGLLLSGKGECNDAVRCGRLALQLNKRFGAPDMETLVVFIAHAFLLHYRKPLLDCQGTLRHQTYPQALRMGDLDSAFRQASLLILAAVFSDASLSCVEKEISQYCKLMKSFSRLTSFNLSAASWQRTQNLLGLADNPVILTGAIMNEETTVSILKRDCQYIALEALFLSKLALALLFEEWDTVASILPVVEKNIKCLRGHLSQYVSYFYVATSSCAIYRVTRHRKHRRSAARAMKQLQCWKADGVAVCTPMVTFIEAEWALTKGMDSTISLYVSAADGFASLKCLSNFQALAYERIGYYYLSKGDRQTSTHFYAIALSKYEEWEALAKVQVLRLHMSVDFPEKKPIGRPDLLMEGSTLSFSLPGSRSRPPVDLD